MKSTGAEEKRLPASPPEVPRTPHVAAVRKLGSQGDGRPRRVWSLLLPPSFERK